MNMPIVRVICRAVTGLLLALLCGVGCTMWQTPLRSPPATSPWDSLRQPSGRGQQFGVNAESREIERSLGIQ